MTTLMTANEVVLDAAAVKAALETPSSQSATRNYPFTVSIYESIGNAWISWALDPNYAIGSNDVVQLLGNGQFFGNFPVTGPVGSVNTKQNWGSGWTAAYWAWDYSSGHWRQLVVTPST